MIVDGIDLSKVNLNKVIMRREEINKLLEQRYEFEQLDAIVEINKKDGYIIGIREVKQNEFWIRGHIPGKPLFPGVLMVETACQLTQFFYYNVMGRSNDMFLALAALDNMKFRAIVVPGDRLTLIAKAKQTKARAAKSKNYIFRGDELIMSGEFTGILIPR